MNDYYTIKEICKVKGGKRIPAGETLQKEKNCHPYIRIVDMYQGKFIYHENMMYAKDSYLTKIRNYTVKSNDVIMAIVGNTLGMVSIIDKSLDGANLTENCCKFDNLDESKVLNDFLYYSLISDFNQKQINKYKVGSSQPKLPMYNINQLLVPKFTIEKQKQIVNLLDKIDRIISNNNIMLNQLLILEEEYYDRYIINSKVDKNDIQQKFLLCGTKKIKELLSVLTGKVDANVANINGKYKFFTCSEQDYKCDNYAFEGKAILVAGNGELNVKHYNGKFNAYQRTYVLIPSNDLYWGIIYMSVMKRVNQLKKSSNGSIVKFIKKGDIENIDILIPSDRKILSQLNKFLILEENIRKENESLKSMLFDLMPLLMNDQLTIE